MASHEFSTNADAFRVTLDSLDTQVTEALYALVTLTASLAMAVDDDPTNASLARQYHAALTDLMDRCADDSDDIDAMLAEIRHIPDTTPFH